MITEPDTQRPPMDQWFVGIGIRFNSRNREVRHVALIYNPQYGETRLSHLRGDFGFADEAWDASYRWQAAGGLDELERPTVVARLHALRRNKPAIPYGFRYKACNFRFESDGTVRFIAGGAEDGFTCSTFIVRLFEVLGWPIVNIATWPKREEDEQWARQLSQWMVTAPDTPRIASVQSRLRTVSTSIPSMDPRVRPEELVGAFVQQRWPVDFVTAEAIARQVIDELASVPLARPPFTGRPGNA